ncbi:MAG: cytochrome c [Bacteroidota bacterium]
MQRVFILAVLGGLTVCCGGKIQERENGFEVSRSKREDKKEVTTVEVPVDLANIGIGPIKEMTFPDEIDEEMVFRGEEKFNTICVSCHMIDQRMIGPPMKGIFERRNPAWVMNILLDPDAMLRDDPITKALLKEYNNAIMPNQNLSVEEARDILEYLRAL